MIVAGAAPVLRTVHITVELDAGLIAERPIGSRENVVARYEAIPGVTVHGT